MSEHARQLARKFRGDLQAPFSSLEQLCAVLVAPLYAFGLIDSHVHATHATLAPEDDAWLQLDAQDKAYILKVYWVQFQELLATKIVVDWLHQLQSASLDKDLWLPFFCPQNAADYAIPVARLSLNTLISILANKSVGQALTSVAQKATPLPRIVKETSLALLARLVEHNTLSDYLKDSYLRFPKAGEALLEWQAFTDAYYSLPAKISNLSSEVGDIPQILEWRVFYLSISRQYERLVHDVSLDTEPAQKSESLVYGLSKIVRSGFMTFEPGQSTFWSAILPQLRRRMLAKTCHKEIIRLWQDTTASLTMADFRTFVLSYTSAVEEWLATNQTPKTIKQATMLLQRIVGPAIPSDDRMFAVAIRGVLLSKAWSPAIGRVLVGWLRDIGGEANRALARLLSTCLELWSERQIIEKAPVAYHTYLTSVLLLAVRSMPALDKALVDMSRMPLFLTAITTHLSTMREVVRLQGMLVAEEVSRKSRSADGPVKPLDFGDIWEAQGPSFDGIRDMKQWLEDSKDDTKVADWEVDEQEEGVVDEPQEPQSQQVEAASSSKRSDAPITNSQTKTAKGNSLIQVLDASSEYDDYDEVDEPDLQPYSLPPKPAAENLKDIEDLSAYTPEKKKPKPPVYIPDLCAYLKSDEANKLDMGLKEAAGLIRRKAQWGTELTDAAVELAYILTGLQDNFSLDHFEERRRQALTALVACAPEKAAPAVVEQIFTNQYSIHQKITMLASLAFGARELAGMPALLPAGTEAEAKQQSFPTQRLPGKLHDRFISNKDEPDANGRDLQLLTEDITNIALSRTRENAEGHIPNAGKEKLLTVRQTRQKVTSLSKEIPQEAFKYPAYNELAVNTFIMPLINRFWLYLRDVATSPQDFRVGAFKGGSAGSVTLLEPMLLSKFLSTVTVLVESARYSPHFLAVLAPEALELVLAIRGINSEDETVQTSMLQLALVVLDGSSSIDAGRTLAREHSKALWQLKDWAEGVWAKTEGDQVGAEGRAAAGVLLRIDGLVQKTVGYI